MLSAILRIDFNYKLVYTCETIISHMYVKREEVESCRSERKRHSWMCVLISKY